MLHIMGKLIFFMNKEIQPLKSKKFIICKMAGCSKKSLHQNEKMYHSRCYNLIFMSFSSSSLQSLGGLYNLKAVNTKSNDNNPNTRLRIIMQRRNFGFSYSKQLVVPSLHSSVFHNLQLKSMRLPNMVGAGKKPRNLVNT